MKTVLEFYNCRNCPLHFHVMEQGCCGDFCSLIFYGTIPNSGIREDCPLKDMKKHLVKSPTINEKDGNIQIIEK